MSFDPAVRWVQEGKNGSHGTSGHVSKNFMLCKIASLAYFRGCDLLELFDVSMRSAGFTLFSSIIILLFSLFDLSFGHALYSGSGFLTRLRKSINCGILLLGD